eukprot:GHVH01013130.1.p1 GENE.GHVH01013130.1~~GHVH01013130.1.p1  ORF type:complete len:296 (+),score=26.06 GHVH01013130.1:87-890(+)
MRQYIVCTLGIPLLVTCVWFTVFGLFGMNAQGQWVNPNVYPGMDEAGMSQIDWNDLSKQPVENLLFILFFWISDIGIISSATSNFLSVLTLIVLVIFFVSSSDSGCFVITVLASGGQRTPPSWQKIFWVWVCALIAIVLMISGGEVALSSLQAMVICNGLPLCVILILITVGLLKTMSLDPYITHLPKPNYGDTNIVKVFKKDIRDKNDKKRHDQHQEAECESRWSSQRDSQTVHKRNRTPVETTFGVGPSSPIFNTFDMENADVDK